LILAIAVTSTTVSPGEIIPHSLATLTAVRMLSPVKIALGYCQLFSVTMTTRVPRYVSC
jgi:hypothetical protein